MSSHREAPEISKDPVADNTDTYAFVSPDRPDTVTIISNYIPLEDPAGGPNFFEFGDEVLYRINIDNTGDGNADVVYEFRFDTTIRDKDTFLYNTGPITSLDSKSFNRPQTYSVTEVRGTKRRTLRSRIPTPPCNIGPRSTPNYPALANAAITDVGNGIKTFAGQRLDGFYVDLGAVFDLAVLRPFQNLHLIPTPAGAPVNALRAFNVHTIAIQVPITLLTRDGKRPTDVLDGKSVIGVWASAHRQKARFRDENRDSWSGPWTQVSRLANPLFNEVIVPMSEKDRWNRLAPSKDSQFAKYVAHPGIGRIAAGSLPGRFPEAGRAGHGKDGSGRPVGDPADRNPEWTDSPDSRTTPGRPRPTCSGSMLPSHRPRARISMASSVVISLAFPMAGGCSTTSSPLSCGPSPGLCIRWWTRPLCPTVHRRCCMTSPTARSCPTASATCPPSRTWTTR